MKATRCESSILASRGWCVWGSKLLDRCKHDRPKAMASSAFCILTCHSPSRPKSTRFRQIESVESIHGGAFNESVASGIGPTKRLGDILRQFASPCRSKSHRAGISSARLPPQRLAPRCQHRLERRSQTLPLRVRSHLKTSSTLVRSASFVATEAPKSPCLSAASAPAASA